MRNMFAIFKSLPVLAKVSILWLILVYVSLFLLFPAVTLFFSAIVLTVVAFIILISLFD